MLTASKSMRYGHAFVPRALALESALLTLRPSVLILKGLLNVPAATSEKGLRPFKSVPFKSPFKSPSNALQTSPSTFPLQHSFKRQILPQKDSGTGAAKAAKTEEGESWTLSL